MHDDSAARYGAPFLLALPIPADEAVSPAIGCANYSSLGGNAKAALRITLGAARWRCLDRIGGGDEGVRLVAAIFSALNRSFSGLFPRLTAAHAAANPRPLHVHRQRDELKAAVVAIQAEIANLTHPHQFFIVALAWRRRRLKRRSPLAMRTPKSEQSLSS